MPQARPPPRQQRTQGAEEDTQHRNFIGSDHTVATLPRAPIPG